MSTKSKKNSGPTATLTIKVEFNSAYIDDMHRQYIMEAVDGLHDTPGSKFIFADLTINAPNTIDLLD